MENKEEENFIPKQKIFDLVNEIINQPIVVDNNLNDINIIIKELEECHNITDKNTYYRFVHNIKQLKNYKPIFLNVFRSLLLKIFSNDIECPYIFDYFDNDNDEYSINLEWEHYWKGPETIPADYMSIVILETELDIMIPSNELTFKYKDIIYNN